MLGIASFSAATVCAAISVDTWIVMAVYVAVGIVGGVCFRRRFGKEALAASLMAIIIMLSFWAKTAWSLAPDLVFDGQTASVTVRVQETLAVSPNARYKVCTVSGDLPEGITLCLWANDVGITPKTGDLLTGNVQLTAALDDADSLDGAYAKAGGMWLYAWPIEGYAMMWSDGRESMNGFSRAVCIVRETIQTVFYEHLPASSAALCESLVIGERVHLDDAMRAQFRACGVYHILAVSGLHLSIVTGVASALTRHMPRRWSAGIAMTVTVMFMTLCGFTPSVVRAGIMMLIVLSGRLFRRRADGLNSLGFAAAVMLLIDPFCIYDVGWQLSFAATLGVLCIFPVWEREITAKTVAKAPLWSRGVLSSFLSACGVSIAAMLTTAPLTAWHFRSLSTVFLLCNMVCIPLTTVLLIMALIAVPLAAISPFLSDVLFLLIDRLCLLVDRFTAAVSRLPFAVVRTEHPLIAVWLAALVIALVIAYRVAEMRGVRYVTAGMLVVLLVGIGGFSVVHRNTVTVTVLGEDMPAAIVQSRRGCGVVFAGDVEVSEAVLAWCDTQKIDRLDWALWADAKKTMRCRKPLEGVTVEHLMLMAPDTAYRRLPVADEVTAVPNEGKKMDDNVYIEPSPSGCRLTVNGTPFMIQWDTSDTVASCAGGVLLLANTLASQAEIAADAQTVISCSYYQLEHFEYVSDRPSVYYTARDGDLVFQIRANGEVRLRSY